MNYDLDYVITKFEAIPEEKWCQGSLLDKQGRACAWGHCGLREDGPISSIVGALRMIGKLFPDPTVSLVEVNDQGFKFRALGSTPKQRVVNYLKALKEFYK